jgi:hypothetical protein
MMRFSVMPRPVGGGANLRPKRDTIHTSLSSLGVARGSVAMSTASIP